MIDWVQIALEFIAVFVGVFFAFELDRYRERESEKGKTIEFLILVKEELEANAKTLKDLCDKLTNMQFIPFYGLRRLAWVALAERIALLTNRKLRSDIIQAYSKFDMYERTLNRYIEFAYAVKGDVREIRLEGPDPMRQKADEHRDAIIAQIQQPKDGMLDFIKTVVEEIDIELKRLQDC